MPQLDGLRALAVGGVMLAHYLPGVARFAGTGALGVKLFFVLSGFLITRILLRSRDAIETRASDLHRQVRRFYLRRFMRLFPALFLLVVCATVLGVESMRRSYLWHITYLSDVYYARLGYWDGETTHLWSLAVEEQFYLFWPLLILLAPRRHLTSLVLAMIVAGPVFRLVATLSGVNPIAVYVLPFACLDTLGLGALLAIAERDDVGSRWSREQICRFGLAVGLPLFALSVVMHAAQRGELLGTVLGDLVAGLAFVWLIGRAATGFRGRWGRFLEWGPLVYVGTISYGVYLYHNFAPGAVRWLFRTAGLPAPLDLWPTGGGPWDTVLHINLATFFVLNVVATLAIATLSWRLVERPINKMRRRFDSAGTARPATGATPAPLLERRA